MFSPAIMECLFFLKYREALFWIKDNQHIQCVFAGLEDCLSSSRAIRMQMC